MKRLLQFTVLLLALIGAVVAGWWWNQKILYDRHLEIVEGLKVANDEQILRLVDDFAALVGEKPRTFVPVELSENSGAPWIENDGSWRPIAGLDVMAARSYVIPIEQRGDSEDMPEVVAGLVIDQFGGDVTYLEVLIRDNRAFGLELFDYRGDGVYLGSSIWRAEAGQGIAIPDLTEEPTTPR